MGSEVFSIDVDGVEISCSTSGATRLPLYPSLKSHVNNAKDLPVAIGAGVVLRWSASIQNPPDRLLVYVTNSQTITVDLKRDSVGVAAYTGGFLSQTLVQFVVERGTNTIQQDIYIDPY